MASSSALNLQQSPTAGVLAGFWKLTPDRAVTLVPGEAGVLRVTHGQVWATLDGPHHGPANDWGDLVLRSGQQLKLTPGQHVVVESYGDAVNESAYFSWEPESALRQEAVALEVAAWQDIEPPVSEPARQDPSGVLALVAQRVVSFAQALARGLGFFVAGRGRVLSYYESNQP